MSRKNRQKEQWIVYVVSPYFSRDHDSISQNIQLAISEAQELVRKGFLPLVVHNHTHHFEQKATAGESFYRAFDRLLLELPCVKAIKCSPTWRVSQGGRIEVFHMLDLEKPVVETFDALEALRDGRPHARVAEITLDERDRKAYTEDIPKIHIVFTIGPYVTLADSKGNRKHMDCILAAEEASIELWNAGFPAFCPQRALCDLEITSAHYSDFCSQMLTSGIASSVVVLPHWENDEESVRQVRLTQERGIPVFGDVKSAVAFQSGEEGYYKVSII